MRRPLIAALIAFTVTLGTVNVAGDSPQGSRRAFGYRVGEERRYILGPPENQRRGESATWLIRLDEIEGEGEDLRATFFLRHERTDLYIDMFTGDSGALTQTTVESVLTVNAHGFPEKLVLSEQLDYGEQGLESDLRTSVYTFTGEDYLKEIRLGGREWEFDIPISSYEDLDLNARRGIFLYLPTGLLCLGQRVRIPEQAPMVYREGCEWSDPAIGNPGLLSLLIPEFWDEEESGEREFLFFTPVSMGSQPAGLVNRRRWLDAERSRMDNIERYWEKAKIELKEWEEIQVGSRTMQAWRLDLWNDIWIDRNGRVLKVELDRHPVMHTDRYIRLQFASEF